MDKSFSTSSRPTFVKSNLRTSRKSKRRKNTTASNPEMFDSYMFSVKNSNIIQLDSSGKSDGKFCYVEGNHSGRNKPDYKVEGYRLADGFKKKGRYRVETQTIDYGKFVVF